MKSFANENGSSVENASTRPSGPSHRRSRRATEGKAQKPLPVSWHVTPAHCVEIRDATGEIEIDFPPVAAPESVAPRSVKTRYHRYAVPLP